MIGVEKADYGGRSLEVSDCSYSSKFGALEAALRLSFIPTTLLSKIWIVDWRYSSMEIGYGTDTAPLSRTQPLAS